MAFSAACLAFTTRRNVNVASSSYRLRGEKLAWRPPDWKTQAPSLPKFMLSTGDLTTDGAAGAAAGIRLAQFLSPSSFATEPMFGTTFFQPSPMLFNAESFFGVTKPEWTSCRRVPVSTLVRVQATTVFSGEP